ncbi:glycosyltransferase family 2 protein [Microbacterium sp. SORGH_AS_0862]|uniref:glycosyltransferase family 2 protein n=1 Tax=Microbacterium sp. SORGH_AS_0862 TaxID=3041789 RepID=UPI002791AC96|nr:glycosyltransferase involved in cell wall biosynthesis [Microbacterium sp. SORGH_AS_0862]
MPRLTVMMPAYNAAGHITTAIRSTLRAMPRDSELLVLDDCSTDDTIKIVARFGDSRVRLITSDENGGGGAARIRMLLETDSEFVASMDADDVAFPWRFRMQLDALKRHDVVFGSAIRFGGGPGRVRPSSVVPLNSDESPSALLFHNPYFHPTMAARRDCLLAVGGYRPLRVAQDYELWLRLATAGFRLRRISVPLIGYRESPSQVTRGQDYLDRVRHSPELRETYVAHARSRGHLDVTAETPRSNLSRLLRSECSHMTVGNRWRYRRLADRPDLPVPLP